MEITCYRDSEISREARSLPAATYNLSQTLLVRSKNGCLFVPIRSMQYLAILDEEEFVFLDGERKNLIDISWQHFHPQRRVSLDDAVEYEAVYYYPHSQSLMLRLHREFHLALTTLASKDKIESPAKVLKFEIKR